MQRKNSILLLVRAVISCAVIALLIYNIDIAYVFRQIVNSRVEFFALLFAIDIIAYTARAWRWHMVLGIWDISFPITTLFFYTQGGRLFDYLLPSSIGGDVYRVYLSARASQSRAGSLLGIVLDRLTGMSAGFVFAGIGLALLTVRHITVPHAEVVIACIAGWFIAMALLFSKRLETLMDSLQTDNALLRKLQRFFQTMALARSHPRRVLAAFCISFLIKSQEIFAAYFVSKALGFDVPFLYCMAFVPVIGFIIVVPVSISGLGIRESLYIFFFTTIGLTSSQAFTLSITQFGWMALMGICGGASYLVWWMITSHKHSHT